MSSTEMIKRLNAMTRRNSKFMRTYGKSNKYRKWKRKWTVREIPRWLNKIPHSQFVTIWN